MSAEQVLEQILEEERSNGEESVRERLRNGICSALIEGEIDKDFFLSSCTRVLEPLYHLCGTDVQSRFGRGARLLTVNVYGSTILKDEARLWLKFIRCRLVRKCGYRRPFFGQISRDIPQQTFRLLADVTRNLDGFCTPCCCHSDSRTTEVIRLTSIRLVNELLILVSCLPAKEVGSSFKRILATGSTKGHKTCLIVTEEKEFCFTCMKNQGKLTISLYVGEWNTNGFPQHTWTYNSSNSIV